MRPSRCFLFAASLAVASFAIGVVSQVNIRGWITGIRPAPNMDSIGALPSGFSDTRGRTKVECSLLGGAHTAILLTLGQSNAANFGRLPYAPEYPVFNFNPADGACYAAAEPLLGATGENSSPWTRLADRLIAAKLFDKVIIVPIAIGGSSVIDWAWGDGHSRMVAAAYALTEAGLSISHVLWHQGETDAIHGMARDLYARHLTVVIRSLRALEVAAPIYIAQASLCGDNPANADIREGQRLMATRLAGVMLGPDSDSLAGPNMRFDGCHFTAPGLDAHARLWFEALTGANGG